MRGVLVLASFGVLALLAGATAARAAAVQESVPVSFTVTNPCNGEEVSTTGTVDFVINEIDTNPSIQYIAAESLRYDVTAIGTTTGTSYVLQDVLHVSTTISDFTTFAPSQSTFTELFHLVSAGSAPDFWALAVWRITITANGNITVLMQLTPQACRG
jgi:hypothetical protein